MATFHDFKLAVSAQFDLMQKHQLFVSRTTKEEIQSMYLDSFKEGDDPLFITNTVHNCTCCKQFINNIGKVLAVVNGELVSIWDIQIGGIYQPVVDALSKLVKADGIDSLYYHFEKNVGQDITRSLTDEGEIKEWEHFHQVLPNKYVITSKSRESIESLQGKARTACSTLRRGLDEITQDSLEVIVDLISQKSLYRGEEHLQSVKNFLITLKVYKELKTEEKSNAVWLSSLTNPNLCVFRNSVIGTLATDLSNNVELEDAVKMFEAKVAPSNYKRPTKLVTKAMVRKAQERATELNIVDSLPRRYATIGDITINNVLFADSSVKPQMNVFDKVVAKSATKTPKMDKVEEISIEDFVNNVLPNAETLELFVENSHKGNLVSLISPENADSELLFKWDNNFSWSYNGEVADSMKERVKTAGGNVDGVLRFSIQWNENNTNKNDLDAHCHYPGGHIYFSSSNHPSTSGSLDVDIQNPGNKIAVENIIFTNLNKMPAGDYKFNVHNFDGSSGVGFTAEIEFGNQIFNFSCNRKFRDNENIPVATVMLDKNKNFTIKEQLSSEQSSKEIWGLSTQNFKKVSAVMMSPNHWDGQKTGNKHYFFMLEDCLNPDNTRGFYNEFLRQELHEDRKVFEMLGSELKAEYSENQLSGLGFSSTQQNHVLVKVTGSFNRTVKIKF